MLKSEEIQLLQNQMRRPSGHVSFQFEPPSHPNSDHIGNGTIFQIVAGSHFFLVTLAYENEVRFYHSTPGLGTRLAIVDLRDRPLTEEALIYLVWSPSELRLHIGSLAIKESDLRNSRETQTDRNFQISQDGQIFEFGLDNVMAPYFVQDSTIILSSTAISSWKENMKAIEILLAAASEDGYLFDTVKTNFAAVSLVTALEVYSKKRLRELDGEGYELDFDRLSNKTNQKFTKERIFAPTANYFQSLDDKKRIWLHLVNIDLSTIHENAWQTFRSTLFPHRHAVVHADPFRATLNIAKGGHPKFITKEFDGFKKLAGEFVTKLHKKTISLPGRG